MNRVVPEIMVWPVSESVVNFTDSGNCSIPVLSSQYMDRHVQLFKRLIEDVRNFSNTKN